MLYNFFKKLFKRNTNKIILGIDHDNRVCLIHNLSDSCFTTYEQVAIETTIENNLSLISNLFKTDIIEGGTVYTKFSLLSTDRFKNEIDDYELLGEYYISMSNNNFDFAYIFNTGSDTKIPATGIGVDSDLFELLEDQIKNEREIKVEVDIDINQYHDQYLNEPLYYINKHQKSGTKICGCNNKKRK